MWQDVHKTHKINNNDVSPTRLFCKHFYIGRLIKQKHLISSTILASIPSRRRPSVQLETDRPGIEASTIFDFTK